MKKKLYISILLAAVFLVASCSQEPREIHIGSDQCSHCKMQISDERFAAQLVTSKGKAEKFDAVECMADYVIENDVPTEETKFWVSNFANPGNWLDAEQAIILKSEEINSPMGESLLAVESDREADQLLQKGGGQHISWNDLIRQ